MEKMKNKKEKIPMILLKIFAIQLIIGFVIFIFLILIGFDIDLRDLPFDSIIAVILAPLIVGHLYRNKYSKRIDRRKRLIVSVIYFIVFSLLIFYRDSIYWIFNISNPLDIFLIFYRLTINDFPEKVYYILPIIIIISAVFSLIVYFLLDFNIKEIKQKLIKSFTES